MKTKLLIAFVLLTFFCNAQEDTTKKETSLNTDVSISTRNVWRGVNYGNSPSVQGNLSYAKNIFEVGTCGTMTMNGNKTGFGNWLELYSTIKYKNFSITVDDYFFFNAVDSSNNYLDWNQKKTQHIVEGRLKYDSKKFDAFVSYVLYSNKYDSTKAIYFEGEYEICKNFSAFVSFVTGQSSLNFYDKGGVTGIGLIGKRQIKINNNFSIPLKTTLGVNPNYKNISKYPDLGYNPVYFVISAMF